MNFTKAINVKNLFRHRFISATFWMFVATGVANAGNYIYHLVMNIMIHSPKIFGEIESAVALLYIFYIPLMTLSAVIIKFISAAKGRGDHAYIGNLYSFFNKILLIGGLIITGILLVVSPFISSFLHFSSIAMAIFLALTFMSNLLSTFVRSIIQGITNFFALAIINFVEVGSKIVLTILLILLGYEALGGIIAFAAAGIVGYLVGFLFIRKLKVKEQMTSINTRPLIKYAIPVFLSNLATTSFITSDILLVRHFFPGVESGYYSFISLLGKIIFFAASPIAFVMFPLVSEHHAKGDRYTHFLYLSLALMMLIILPLLVIYSIFPELVVSIFPRKEYAFIAPLLGSIGLFFGLYAVNSLLTSFYLSIHKVKAASMTLAGAFLQLILIFFFHQSLNQVILMSIISSFVLLLGLLLYYPYARR